MVGILEAALAGQDYLCGDRPTIADLSVASNITQRGLANAAPETENVSAWYERICAIPGFRKALPN